MKPLLVLFLFISQLIAFAQFTEPAYSVYSSTGELLAQTKYNYVKQVSDSSYLAGRDFQYAVVDKNFKPITNFHKVYNIIDRGFPPKIFAENILTDSLRNKFLHNLDSIKDKNESYGEFPFGFMYYRQKKEENGALADRLLNQVFPTKYNFANRIYYIATYLTENKKWGVIDSTGREIIPPLYDDVTKTNLSSAKYNSGIYLVSRSDSNALISGNGEVILPLTPSIKYVNPIFNQKSIFMFKNPAGKYGLMDLNGDIVLAAEYDNINTRQEWTIGTIEKDGKVAFINSKGKIITPFRYSKKYTGGGQTLSLASRDSLNCIIDTLGNEILAVKGGLEIIDDDPRNKPYIQETDELTFYRQYDFQGNPIKIDHGVPDSIYRCVSRNFSTLETGFLDGHNKLVIPREYIYYRSSDSGGPDSLYYDRLFFRPVFLDGRCLVAKKDLFGQRKFGIIDRNNNIILPFDYWNGEVHSFFDIAFMGKNDGYGLVDIPSGKALTKFKYGAIEYLGGKSSYFLVYDLKDKQGLVDYQGREFIPCEYDYISYAYNDTIDFDQHNYFIVGKGKEGNEQYGIFDTKTSKLVVPLGDGVHLLSKNKYRPDLVIVSKNGSKTLLDLPSIRTIIPFGKYDKIGTLTKNLLLVKESIDNKSYYGVVDISGKEIIPSKYSQIYVGAGGNIVCQEMVEKKIIRQEQQDKDDYLDSNSRSKGLKIVYREGIE